VRVSLDIDQPILPDENILSRRPWYVIGLGLILLSLLLRQPLLVIAGLLIIALGAIPELWYRYCLAGVVVRRRLSEQHAMYGDEVSLTVSVENRKLLPLPWLEVEDELPEALPVRGMRLRPSVKAQRRLLTNTVALWLYQRLTRRYAIRCVARGVYAFGPLWLRSGDPFGLLTREQRVEDVSRLVVYPLLVSIARLGLPARHPFGERTAPRRLLEDPLRVAGVRPYALGDEPRRIHWKATARTGAVQSKVYEPATRHTLVLFVDVRTLDTPIFGYDSSLFELAMCTAASVAAWGLDQGYAVGLFANGVSAPVDAPPGATARTRVRGAAGDDARTDVARRIAAGAASLRVRVPPASRVEQLPRALDALARLYPYLGTGIESVIAAEGPGLPFGATVVYVGAAAVLGNSGVAALSRLKARGHAVTLVLTGDAPIDAGALATFRVGGKEVWDALETAALGGGAANALTFE
jgi:uncharacterized protein (DUF58 family)